MKTVFIVDDNDANLFAAQAVLMKRYNVFTLPSAIAMFKLIEKVKPDIILMDIKMPEMDGFDAVRKLKADDRYASVPVIFLTGQTDVNIEKEGFELGAVDFIPKPFSEPVMLGRVKAHLEIEELISERTALLQAQVDTLKQKITQMESEAAGT